MSYVRNGSARVLPVLLLIAGLLLSACGNGDDADAERYNIGEPLENDSLAIVVTSDFGGDTLTTDQFNQQIQQAMQQMPPTEDPEDRMEEVHRRVAEGFVLSHLVQGEMDRLNLQPSEAEIEEAVGRQISAFRQRAGGEEGFEQQLQAMGMTVDSLRAALRPQIREQLRQRQYQDTLLAQVEEPTDEEVGQYAEEQRREEIRAQHILFTVDEGENEDSVRTFASAILDSAQAGADFAGLAERYSEGPSAPRGGDLGWFGEGQMVPEFEEAAFALPDTGVVADELVQTQFGYHIIRLTGQRRSPAMDTTRARGQLMQERRREAIEQALDDLREQGTVRLNSDVVEADLNEPEEEQETGGTPQTR